MTPEATDRAQLIDSDLTMYVHAIVGRMAICTTDAGDRIEPTDAA